MSINVTGVYVVCKKVTHWTKRFLSFVLGNTVCTDDST